MASRPEVLTTWSSHQVGRPGTKKVKSVIMRRTGWVEDPVKDLASRGVGALS